MATFKEAFRAARKAGKGEFSWNGKSYNTKLKEGGDSKPKPKPGMKTSARPPTKASDKPSSGNGKRKDDNARRGGPGRKPTGSNKPKISSEGASKMTHKDRTLSGRRPSNRAKQ